MAREIKDRLEAAIREADERSLGHLRASNESTTETENAMQPVRQAAEEIREEVRPTPSVRITINPDSVGISLADRELWCTYEPRSQKFTGEESAHSWYDGERYAERYEWANAEECIDAMIKLSAQFVRMARAIGTAAG